MIGCQIFLHVLKLLVPIFFSSGIDNNDVTNLYILNQPKKGLT